VSINLVPPSPPGDPAPRSPEAPPGGAGYRARLSAAKTVLRQRASRLPGHHYLGGLSRRAEDVTSWAGHRLGRADVPAFHLRRLARKGVDTLVVVGSYEGRELRRGEAPMLWRLQKKGAFDVVVLPTIDHTLFTQAARRLVLPLLAERVRAQCARAAATASAAPPQGGGPPLPGTGPGPRADFAATR
jgi:hypothetical protein